MTCAKKPTEAQRLVLENMGYIRFRVAMHLKRYGHREMFDEVLQEAVVGACKASQTYRHGAGAKFTTWSNLEVDAAVHRAMRTLPHVVVPPRISQETLDYADGARGYRKPLRAVDPAVLGVAYGERRNEIGASSERLLVLVREATTTNPDEALADVDAATLRANAKAGISRHLPGHRDKARRVDVYLRVFYGELQSDIAEELGISRQSVSQMVARVQPAFDAWAAEVRNEVA